MWKKGELVWVSLNLSDTWIPGRILDPCEPFGVLVSFFGLMEPRYVPKPCLRSFDRDFRTLISDSRSFRRFVNRALRAHFWNISFGLWCSCQAPIDSPYFDRENSLPWFPLSSDSVLGFVRDMAISLRMPLRRLAEINTSSAQILSFRRYIVDFKRSESVYEEIKESAIMDQSKEQDWCLDHSNKVDDCIDLVAMFPEAVSPDMENSRDPLPKDIHCCFSLSSEKHVDKEVQVYTWNTRNPITSSDSSIMRACETRTQTVDHEDGHLLKRRKRCQDEQSTFAGPGIAVSEASPDDVMIETHDGIVGSDDRTVISAKPLSPLLDASDDKAAFLAKPVSFVIPEAFKTPSSSMKKTYAKPSNKLDSSMTSVKSLNEEPSDRTRGNCSDDALKSYNVEVEQVSPHITGTSNNEFSSNDVGITPGEKKLQDLDAAKTVENQARAVDNVTYTGVKRKTGRDKRSKKKKKASQQSVSTDKPLNLLHWMKDMRLAEPKCLQMKFLSRHGIPSKAELLKRFSVFGKLDASRTDVNPEKSSAKIVFLQSINAVTAYQFARSKKFTFGRSKVMYRLVPFEEVSEVNKVPMLQKPQESIPTPKSCLKKHGTPDKEEEERRNLKVKFRIETNS